MAEHNASVETQPAGPFDMQEHRRTYQRFLAMCKWGGISAAISQQIRTFIEQQGGLGAVLASLGIPLGGHEDHPSDLDDEPDYG